MSVLGAKGLRGKDNKLGHLQKRNSGYIGQRMLKMEVPGRKKRGRPDGRFIDLERCEG